MRFAGAYSKVLCTRMLFMFNRKRVRKKTKFFCWFFFFFWGGGGGGGVGGRPQIDFEYDNAICYL